MPDQISVADFLAESWEDYNSPTTSNFVSRMAQCKNTISALEETLDNDRSGLNKMKKSVKALTNSGLVNMTNEAYLAENLERLGATALNREHEFEIGEAFKKFAVVTRDLSMLMKNLMQNISNILLFPLDSVLKGELKGVKGDLKKPFDKATKDYDTKFTKIEKEKKRLAVEAGMIKTEVTGAEAERKLGKLIKLRMKTGNLSPTGVASVRSSNHIYHNCHTLLDSREVYLGLNSASSNANGNAYS